MGTGERIKERRRFLGLSAEEVADKIGVSPATIYRYESHYINNMGIDKLSPIAKVLDTTEAYLMGLTDNPSLTSYVIPPRDSSACQVCESITNYDFHTTLKKEMEDSPTLMRLFDIVVKFNEDDLILLIEIAKRFKR